jgi:DNA-binding CsgD family transcriptional regulator
MSMARKLTARQREVMRMRFDRGASIEQIADWLGITRRAVLYRLRNARNRRGEITPSRRRSNVPRGKVRLYAASQMTAESTSEILGMEEL